MWGQRRWGNRRRKVGEIKNFRVHTGRVSPVLLRAAWRGQSGKKEAVKLMFLTQRTVNLQSSLCQEVLASSTRYQAMGKGHGTQQ